MPSTVERLVRNQTVFREVNERVLELASADAAAPIQFLCECSHTDCAETIRLPLVRYEAVRANADCFLVVAGHEIPAIESVVASDDGYVVVRKMVAREIVIETDARSNGKTR